MGIPAGLVYLEPAAVADQKTYMVELLMKQDQMSMACSIESRVPFLDHPLVEFSTRVPERLKLRGGIGKYIVKKAARAAPLESHRIPQEDGLPYAGPRVAARSEIRRRGAAAERRLPREYLRMEEVGKLLDRHQRGAIDATDRIWRLLNLQLWGDLYFTGK
jgi:asparagine synthase (glutamine-hydrolysing)